MKQLLAYKYRIYPTEDQQVLLSKTFGCKRVIFNHYLNEQQVRYKNKEKNILRIGQLDCYGEAMKSQATGDLELKTPLALQKMTSKIERPDICLSVGHRSGQATRSLVV